MHKISLLSSLDLSDEYKLLSLYSMETVITTFGYQPETLSYYPKENVEQTKEVSLFVQCLTTLKSILKGNAAGSSVLNKTSNRGTYNSFVNKRLNLSSKLYVDHQQITQAPPSADAIISIGSIAYRSTGHQIDPTFCLNFIPSAKRIVYGACFDDSQSAIYNQSCTENCLESIKYFSVNKKSDAEAFKSLTGNETHIVADPIFLLDARDWSGFASSLPIIGKGYLLCCFSEADEYMRETALRIARQRQLRPVILQKNATDTPHLRRAFTVVKDVGLEGMVQMLRDADYVCTDGYLGVAFSIIFKRTLLAFKSQLNARSSVAIQSLLDQAQLSERLVDVNSAENTSRLVCNMDKAESAIRTLKHSSIGYLKTALNDALSDENNAGFEHVA